MVSLGSHDNMQRVARFFLTGETTRPDGTVGFVKPHEYGALVLLYSHPEEFFPAADVPQVRESLRRLSLGGCRRIEGTADKLRHRPGRSSLISTPTIAIR